MSSPTTPPATTIADLSPRQQRLVWEAARGLTSKEIGAEMGIRPGTVKNMFDAVYERVGVTNRSGLARWTVEQMIAADRRRIWSELGRLVCEMRQPAEGAEVVPVIPLLRELRPVVFPDRPAD